MISGPADIVRQCLIDQALVVMPPPINSEIPCYTSSAPDDVDKLVLIRDTAGRYFGRSQRGIAGVGRRFLHPGIKINVRALDPRTGYDLCQQIVDALETINNATTVIDNVRHYVKTVYLIGNIIDLGEETGKKRQLFSINGRAAMGDLEPVLG